MVFRKEDHQALQSMYHFKVKVDPAFANGVCSNWCGRSNPEDMPGADPEQALTPCAAGRGCPPCNTCGGKAGSAVTGPVRPHLRPPCPPSAESAFMLETQDLTVRFGGHVAVNAVSCAFRAGHAHRHRRPQRRRQDDLLQPDLGPDAGPARARCCCAARTSRRWARRRGAGGHGPRVPAHQPVPQPHGARKTSGWRCKAGPAWG
jgi:hypothetical protein